MKEKRDIMSFFYETKIGRIILKPLTTAPVSKAVGFLLNKRFSKIFIKGFIKKHGISLDDYVPREYSSFNDFFTREIIPSRRIFDKESSSLCSPCDGFLLHFKIGEDSVFKIKGIEYTLSELLGKEKLDKETEKFLGGDILIFRLEATNFHHYAYFDSCLQGENHLIKGEFHTVREIAYKSVPIFRRNQRSYCQLKTKNFGEAIQIEVGALFVGKISNFHNDGGFSRGEEKGMFEFGGSTIILLFEKGKIKLSSEIEKNSKIGKEQIVKMGEKIGSKMGFENEQD